MIRRFLGFLLVLPFFAITGATATPDAFTCPVTAPNETKPDAKENPFHADETTYYEDGIWVTIPADGVQELTPADEVQLSGLEGWRSSSHTWMRADDVEGWVIVSGKRLDAPSDLAPRTPLSPQRQYVQRGYVKTGIAFPHPGCWEVTGTVGTHQITWVMDVRFVDLVR